MQVNLYLLGSKITLNDVHQALAIPLMVAWIALVAVGLPLLAIWVLDTLFPALAILYGFYQWLAMYILMKYVSSLKKESE